MNIEQAKQQIENAMKAYFTKDEFGNYVIPTERQRPVFLLGAPGIGKTAIMEQIARDLDVGLVSYAMTHHTRQSAIGLPFITTKTYGGTEYEVSEYTMSEIIASVYDAIEQTGKHEGILFLDEINCVSETLTPAILQFLQYKVFGRHQVPAGWIVVTAGNPPEYNRSIHDFDIATWDRLKRIDVEPDFEVWKHYAFNHGVHPAILTYLEIKPGDFYKVETTVEGKSFVTARGWD
ncbi:MAG: AAA family ATPase, partial [Raoultibacter sp.]